MCGIVGYVGPRDVASVLVDGLKRLDYRGYDSCGVAILNSHAPRIVRSVGRIRSLEEKLQNGFGSAGVSRCGIGHTRWATHGRPSEANAHPHRDCTGRFFVAHNGIIENYFGLKQSLSGRGHRFLSATDTEVLPHLIESHYDGDFEAAIRAALKDVEGLYGIVAVSSLHQDQIIAVRKGPPLVIGIGNEETFIASDVPALLPYTRTMLFLKDGEMAVIDGNGVVIKDFEGKIVVREPEIIEWSADMAEKDGYPHFMLKEIYEQPRAVRDTLCGRIAGDDTVNLTQEMGNLDLDRVSRIGIVACGTSLHAGLIGKFLLESLAKIPVEVDFASEFRYRDPLVDDKTLIIGISQSGETADTLAAMKEAREKGAQILAICNVVGSQVSRQSDAVVYTHAGPEIGVASTKAFTTQLTALFLTALHIAQSRRAIPSSEIGRYAGLLRGLPDLITRVLDSCSDIPVIAEKFMDYPSFLYLGRGVQYPIAMEGALKLKEISYIHAEGYTAGEMKHGPIALIDKKMPVVVLAPKDNVYRKTMGNIEEVKVRDGIVIAIATEGDTEICEKADHVVFIPQADPFLTPVLTVVPLQLLSYYMASFRQCDVDKPRNLAKSVTVE